MSLLWLLLTASLAALAASLPRGITDDRKFVLDNVFIPPSAPFGFVVGEIRVFSNEVTIRPRSRRPPGGKTPPRGTQPSSVLETGSILNTVVTSRPIVTSRPVVTSRPFVTSRPIVTLRPAGLGDHEPATPGATASEGVKSDAGVKTFGQIKSNSGLEVRPTEEPDSLEALADARPLSSSSIVKANLSFRLEEMLRKRPTAESRSKTGIRTSSEDVVQHPKSLVSPESRAEPKPKPPQDFTTLEELESFLSSSSNDEFEAFLRSSTDEELQNFLRLATEEKSEPSPAPEADEDLQAFLAADSSKEFEAIVIPGLGQEPGAIIIIGPEHESNTAERTHAKRTTEPASKLREPAAATPEPAAKLTEPELTAATSAEELFGDDEDLPDMIISGATITFTRPFRERARR